MPGPHAAARLPSLFEHFTVEGSTIEARFNAGLSGRYIREGFFATYPEDLPLAAMARTILMVPPLFNVAPVVWLSGKAFAVPSLDEATARTLHDTKLALQSMYPGVAWSGEIVPSSVVPEVGSSGASGAGRPTKLTLFSGGLDSVFTSLRHHTHKQLLVSVWGADVRLDEESKWEYVAAWTRQHAEDFGHEAAFVRTNLRTFLNEDFLNSFGADIHNWWGGVQHGLGLTGITAPLAEAYGVPEVLIASTHSATFQAPWGSHPSIDDHVAWGATHVSHDGYELTRMGKLAYCQDHCHTAAIDPPVLRVCYSASSRSGENCCQCEKCLRTIAGLIVLGENPNDWGFSVSDEVAVERIRRGFGAKKFKLGANGVYMWQDIQAWANREPEGPHVRRAAVPARGALLDWLSGVDFSSLLDAETARPTRAAQLKRFVKANFPRGVTLLRRLQRRPG